MDKVVLILVGLVLAVSLAIYFAFLQPEPAETLPQAEQRRINDPLTLVIPAGRTFDLVCIGGGPPSKRGYRFAADGPVIFLIGELSTPQDLEFTRMALACREIPPEDAEECDFPALRARAEAAARQGSYREAEESDWVDVIASNSDIDAGFVCPWIISGSDQPTTITITTSSFR